MLSPNWDILMDDSATALWFGKCHGRGGGRRGEVEDGEEGSEMLSSRHDRAITIRSSHSCGYLH